MAVIRLNQQRIDGLGPRGKTYGVRDAQLRGFGVRVFPSGKKTYFVHSRRKGRNLWRVIGDAGLLPFTQAREEALALLACESRTGGAIPRAAGGVSFRTLAAEVLARYRTLWKPGTFHVNSRYCRTYLLPWFGDRFVGEITRQDVQEWFASLHRIPAVADRAIPVLSVIFREAETLGYREEDSNPCKGVKRYRRRGRERFLSNDELRRFGQALDLLEAEKPMHVAYFRLLLLTGCRSSEIRSLRWKDYREGKLYLRDSKTGPRTVWLSSAARGIFDALPRTSSWIFPGRNGRTPMAEAPVTWKRLTRNADLHDLCRHDLRHTYASVALAHGENLRTIGMLLGHNDPASTLKYTNFVESAVRQAAETVGAVLIRN